jgi:hypothetical protein
MTKTDLRDDTWRDHFGFCQTPRVLTSLEAWMGRRQRSYLWRQWQNGPNRFKELHLRGVPKFDAAMAGGSPTKTRRNTRRSNKLCESLF